MTIKPVADLYSISVPGGRSTTYSTDAEEASDCRAMGWEVQEYVKLERSEETLQREVCKIVDGHDRMQKKLKETEAKLEATEKRIAELSHHLQCAHAFIEHTEAFGHEASNGILCCGDAQWNIDASKLVLAAAGKGEAS